MIHGTGQAATGFPGDRARPGHADGSQRAQRRRLDAMLVDGRLEPKSFEVLLKSLLEGYDSGLLRTSGVEREVSRPPSTFRKVERMTGQHKIVTSRYLSRRSARQRAKQLVKSGYVTTLFVLDPTARFHRQYFTKDGYWEYVGGIFGRSDRSQKYVKLTTFKSRIAEEMMRISHIRNPLSQ